MAKTKPVSWSLQKPSCRFVKCDAGLKHGSSTAQGRGRQWEDHVDAGAQEQLTDGPAVPDGRRSRMWAEIERSKGSCL